MLDCRQRKKQTGGGGKDHFHLPQKNTDHVRASQTFLMLVWNHQEVPQSSLGKLVAVQSTDKKISNQNTPFFFFFLPVYKLFKVL